MYYSVFQESLWEEQGFLPCQIRVPLIHGFRRGGMLFQPS